MNTLRDAMRGQGVRMALGAHTRQVMWPFVKRTVVQLALGFTLGMTGALSSTG